MPRSATTPEAPATPLTFEALVDAVRRSRDRLPVADGPPHTFGRPLLIFQIPIKTLIEVDHAMARIESAIHGFGNHRDYEELPMNIAGARAQNIFGEDGQVARLIAQYDIRISTESFRLDVAVR